MTLTGCQDHILTENMWFYGLKHHTVDIRGDVTMRDKHVKMELLSQWMLEAEFCNYSFKWEGG